MPYVSFVISFAILFQHHATMRKIILLTAFAVFISSCKKQEKADDSYTIFVTDNGGNLQPDASINVYHSVEELKSDSNPTVLSANGDGFFTLPDHLVADSLICRAEKGTLTSEFNAFKYAPYNRMYKIVVRHPGGDQLLCGHGSKNWIMTSYSVNGVPTPYNVTSTLNADGTWTDSNGNSGNWHFENGFSELIYDYTSSGMTVNFEVQELTADFISLRGMQSGMVIDMEMTAE